MRLILLLRRVSAHCSVVHATYEVFIISNEITSSIDISENK